MRGRNEPNGAEEWRAIRKGRATAELLVEYGAQVCIADINLNGVTETADRILTVGGWPRGFPAI
ncbi:hypothetical protein AAXB25_22520 [Paenibacillus lautus]|uniref:hypothetical protein n=1 Tax=Paenibacillus lautus TaxID=1401 RepID=UPI003D2868BD